MVTIPGEATLTKLFHSLLKRGLNLFSIYLFYFILFFFFFETEFFATSL